MGSTYPRPAVNEAARVLKDQRREDLYARMVSRRAEASSDAGMGVARKAAYEAQFDSSLGR